MDSNKAYAGHILALCTVIVWGITFVSTKILLVEFQAIEIAMFRFILAFLFLNIIMPARLHVRDWKRELYFIGAGLTGVTLYFMTENVALIYTSAANVGVIISTVPFFTAIVGRVFFKGKKFTKKFLLGFVVAMAGIIAITYNGATELQLNPMGDLLTLAAAMAWAFYSNFVNKISTWSYPMIQVTRRIFFYGILFMIPFTIFLPFEWNLGRLANGVYLGNLLYLGFVASGICFVTWNIAVRKIGTVKTTIYIYLSPVVTIIASVIVLDEPMTVVTFAGVILTTIGLVISGRE
ncbi:MAG: DMT family transporter [Eubacteriales bacterium]